MTIMTKAVKKLMIEKVGDRDKNSYSIKEYAFTINANPMSDRVQMVMEIYEDSSDTTCDK